MAYIQTQKTGNTIIRTTLENGVADGPYEEDWGDFIIKGQKKKGELDGTFRRFNTDAHHRNHPVCEYLSEYRQGKLQAEFKTNDNGIKHGDYTKYGHDGKPIETGTFQNGTLKSKKVMEKGKCTAHILYYKDGQTPMRQTTFLSDGTQIRENFDTNGVSSGKLFYKDGCLIKTEKPTNRTQLKPTLLSKIKKLIPTLGNSADTNSPRSQSQTQEQRSSLSREEQEFIVNRAKNDQKDSAAKTEQHRLAEEFFYRHHQYR
ncbi:MAG: hypothetical protein IJV07_02770 [Alphaproteobacteria bacterium]|nr:hypothetical protein [Alphaproteobacteria bacterium]